MQEGGRGLAANLISEEDLEGTLAAGLQRYPGLRPERAARALIAQLRGRNFMLCSVGGTNYAFVHRTFLEYFSDRTGETRLGRRYFACRLACWRLVSSGRFWHFCSSGRT